MNQHLRQEILLLYLGYFIYPVLDTMFYLNCEPAENSPGEKIEGLKKDISLQICKHSKEKEVEQTKLREN